MPRSKPSPAPSIPPRDPKLLEFHHCRQLLKQLILESELFMKTYLQRRAQMTTAQAAKFTPLFEQAHQDINRYEEVIVNGIDDLCDVYGFETREDLEEAVAEAVGTYATGEEREVNGGDGLGGRGEEGE